MKRISIVAFLIPVSLAGSLAGAQTAAPGPAPRTPLPAAAATPAEAPKIEANLLQLMRGMLFPASNVVFAAQGDLKKFRQDDAPSVSPNLLTSVFGGWEAIENASLTLAESANLLLLPGRACANGRIPPVDRADWVQFTRKLRDAGNAAYKAAQSKSQDAMIDVSGVVAESCSACHNVYRRDARGDTSNRCLPR
jgi:hypothetical protein